MKKIALFLSLLFVTTLHADTLPKNTGLKGYAHNSKDGITMSESLGSNRVRLHEMVVTNNSGGAINLGIGVKLPINGTCLSGVNCWVFGLIDDSATPDFTDDTTDAQDSGTGDIIVFSTDTNDGSLICADKPFGLWGVTVSQAETGSPVYAHKYYNGSSMAALTMIEAPSSYTVGNHVHVFNPPDDWAVSTTNAVNDNSVTDTSGKYCVEAIATTAPSQAVLGSVVWVHDMKQLVRSKADNGFISWSPYYPISFDIGEEIVPYFGGTANAANTYSTIYSIIK